jgi:formyltetrahydrofolate synthetase
MDFNAIGAEENALKARCSQLIHQQGTFGIHAAPVNGSRVGFQNGRNDRRKISVAARDAFETGNRTTGSFELGLTASAMP